ncbi:unnamed protein product [Linum tenue]|uniref:Aminotransferase class I/classII large domain-containing protein n=1 Tax=Linum tenue TaxID=586396 RepID=A0AAV0K6V0_9ROSI|nr:unnamed protein product [Linum tenue]
MQKITFCFCWLAQQATHHRLRTNRLSPPFHSSLLLYSSHLPIQAAENSSSSIAISPNTVESRHFSPLSRSHQAKGFPGTSCSHRAASPALRNLIFPSSLCFQMASSVISAAASASPSACPVTDLLKGKAKLGSGNVGSLFIKDKGNPFLNSKSCGRITMAVAVNVSRFEAITMAPPDPILGVSEAFKADNDEKKLNLGVGAYRTEELQPYVLDVVKKAENLMLERGENKEYLPIEGLAAFNKATAELLFGADSPVISEQRVATIQGLSGTGSLRLAAVLIERYFPGAKVLISSPTWGNHKNIFNDARVPWSEYRYYDPKTVGLDFEGMIEDIKAAPEGSFVLLHGCAHNPTGIDPTPEQWEKIADVIQEKNHIPFFDVAYQGFASGSLDQDAASVRLFAARGMEIFVAQSYSKNLGLYSERIGAINVVCSSSDTAARVKSQLKRIARPMYSNPPIHGARIVANVVGDPALFGEWKAEMEMMAGRIKGVRQKLYDSLTSKDKSGKDWSFILKQIGMFSFTGLNKIQVTNQSATLLLYHKSMNSQ